jgi:hypothetical protein
LDRHVVDSDWLPAARADIAELATVLSLYVARVERHRIARERPMSETGFTRRQACGLLAAAAFAPTPALSAIAPPKAGIPVRGLTELAWAAIEHGQTKYILAIDHWIVSWGQTRKEFRECIHCWWNGPVNASMFPRGDALYAHLKYVRDNQPYIPYRYEIGKVGAGKWWDGPLDGELHPCSPYLYYILSSYASSQGFFPFTIGDDGVAVYSGTLP